MSADRQRTLRRLFRYSRPYRGRLLWALAGMVVYAAGAAGLAALIKPIFDIDPGLPLSRQVQTDRHPAHAGPLTAGRRDLPRRRQRTLTVTAKEQRSGAKMTVAVEPAATD